MRDAGRWLGVAGIALIAMLISALLLIPEASAAVNPEVTLSAVTLSFGDQLVGSRSEALSVTLTNSGAAPLAISTFRIEGADAADFAQAADCPVSPDVVPVGGSCTMYVSFRPDGAGPRSARLVIGDDAASSPQSVGLSGSGGTAPQPPAGTGGLDFGLPPGTFLRDDFESGSLGRWGALSSSGSSATLDLAVANSGTAAVRLTNTGPQQSSRLMADLAGGGQAQSYTRFCFRIAAGVSGGIEIANGRAITAEYPLGIRRWLVNYNPVTKGLEGYFFSERLQRLDLYAANGQVEPGRWYCAEVYLDERADGRAELWLDGVSVGSVAGDLSTPSPYSRLYLWNQPDPGSVWFDDVAVTDTPSGPTGAGSAGLPGPAAAVSPASVDLGAQITQTRSPARSATLTNTGTSAMTVRSVAIHGADAGDFAQSNDCPPSLPAGASCSASVTLTPSATGARSASLSFEDGSPGSPHAIALTGTGVGSGAATVSTAHLVFDDRVVDTRSDAQAVTVTSTGTAPLVISTFRITGADAGDFAQGADCPVSPDALPVGASCTVYVSFRPGGPGSKSATLVIGDNAGSGSDSVALTGSGVTGFAAVTLSDGSLSFGDQPVGSRSEALSVKVKNSGAAPLAISTFRLQGADPADFSQAADCPVSPAIVPVGGSCTIYVSFSPGGPGPRSAVLAIGDNAASSPQSVALNGAGATAPQARMAPGALDFGAQTAQRASAPRTVTLSNTGRSPLSIGPIALAGADAGDFARTDDCPSTLGAGASCAVDVTFTPAAPGARTASLVVSDSAPDPSQSVSLTGLGLPAGTYLSDDFESGTLGGWDALSSGGSSVALDSAVTHFGSAAVRLTNSGDQQSSRLMADLAGGGHAQSYTRFCFRIGTGVSGGIEIANGRAIDAEYPLGIRRWIINYNPVTRGLEGYFFNEDLQRLDLFAANGQVQTGRWYCAQLYLDERADGHAALWLDGVSVGTATGNLSTPNPYSRIYLWNQPSAGSVWFDDVTVADAPSP